MAKKYTNAMIEKEADQIFMKLNPQMAMKDGSFPMTGPMMPAEYNREYNRVFKQVKKTRKAMNK